MARWVEPAAGAIAALVSVAVAASMLHLGAYAWAAAVVGLSGVGAGVGTLLDIVHRRGPWLAITWASAAALMAMTALAVLSVGLFLLPGTMAAFIAAATGTLRSPQSTPGQ